MDTGGGFRVQAGEDAVGVARAFGGCAPAETLPQFGMARRSSKQPVHQSAQIKAGSTDDDRQTAASGDLRQNGSRAPCVLARGGLLLGFQNVEQMMRNTAALGERGLGRADIEVPVELQRIAVDDLTPESLRQMQRKARFPARRRAGDDPDCRRRGWLPVHVRRESFGGISTRPIGPAGTARQSRRATVALRCSPCSGAGSDASCFYFEAVCNGKASPAARAGHRQCRFRSSRRPEHPPRSDTAGCGKQQGNDPQMQRGMAIGCAELRYREPMGTLYK